MYANHTMCDELLLVQRYLKKKCLARGYWIVIKHEAPLAGRFFEDAEKWKSGMGER
jgi:hypothetical protein